MLVEKLSPQKMTGWTHFWDMHSGGRLKIEPYHHIHIEAPESVAVSIFAERFGRDPGIIAVVNTLMRSTLKVGMRKGNGNRLPIPMSHPH